MYPSDILRWTRKDSYMFRILENHCEAARCFVKYELVTECKTEGEKEVMGIRRRRRCKQLLDDIKETMVHWKLKEDTLDRPVQRTHVGRSNGPVLRQLRYK
jgi:hypothetical protein